MSINSDTIATIIKRLNSDLFLPAMQRDYVWKVEQIYTLFDSLMQGYPISTFLFWKVPEGRSDTFERYSFLRRVKTKDNFTNMGELPLNDRQITFVLDGQQRLTSINVGIQGEYVAPKGGGAKAQVAKILFLNVLHDADVTDKNSGHRYHFEFKERFSQKYYSAATTKDGQPEYWVPVNDIYALRVKKDKDSLYALIENITDSYARSASQNTISSMMREKIKHNVERLYVILFELTVLAHHTEDNGNEEKMLEIFIRANNGGTPLRKADLLLSTLTLHWKESNQSAKTITKDLLNQLNKLIPSRRADDEEGEGGNKFKIDFLMKACLVLLNLPVAYNIKSFSKETCGEILNKWGEIKKALVDTVSLVQSFGITSSTLLSVNALMPIAYYFYTQKPTGLVGQTNDPGKVTTKENIRIWLHGALINGIFGGTSDQTISKLRDCLANTGSEFNVKALDDETAKLGEKPVRDPRTIDEIMTFNYKNKEKCFLALAMIYPIAAWKFERYSIDHLFPQKNFEKGGALHGYESQHQISNLCLISLTNNSIRGDTPLDYWAAHQNEEYLREHLIPSHPALWKTDQYEAFTAERTKLLKEKFEKIFLINAQ
jgi:hypothetical protein